MIHNFRDLGGLTTKCDRTVKDGLLFRTGNLSHIQSDHASHVANERQVRVYVDFRNEFEIKRFGAPSELIAQKVEWVNLPIQTDDPDFQALTHPEVKDWISLYHRLFEKNAHAWMKFLRIIAEADAPVAYGCLFGKDRTGIASSLLLEALNVHDDQIANDYAKTENHIEPLYRRFESLWDDRPMAYEDVFKHYLRTPPQIMQGFLDHVRTRAVIDETQVFLEHLPTDMRIKLQNRLLRS